MLSRDSAKHNSIWTIRKFEKDDNLTSEEICRNYYEGIEGFSPFDVVEIPDNILLNVGITEIWKLISGDVTGTPYNNGNSVLVVGNDSTAEDATQTGVIAALPSAEKGMEATFPTIAGQTITFRSVFAGTEANGDWREFSVYNGVSATTGIAMNRKADAQGTKANGQTWTLDLSITLS